MRWWRGMGTCSRSEVFSGCPLIFLRRVVRSRMRRISVLVLPVLAIPLAFLLQGCNALNPLCGSARPAPVIGSLSPSTITFAQVQQGFVLTVNGSQFVSASVGVVNGAPQTSQILGSTQLKMTLTTAVISGPGTVNVKVNTPAGNSGNLGCTSGGTSRVLVLTVT
jgi:hypothetical protein